MLACSFANLSESIHFSNLNRYRLSCSSGWVRGLTPYDDSDEVIIFEAFETSPTAEQTLAVKGSFKWDFPGRAAALPVSEFENPLFQESLSAFIEKASLEPIDEFAAKARKAGVEISEARNTINPALITEFLMTVLETNGSREYLPVLRKSVKDDVCWDNAELPWRRSPFWLALRVCIQRLLYLRLGAALGRIYYKFLICSLMAQLLEDSINQLAPEQCNFLRAKLCRRLAKLEIEKVNSAVTVFSTFQSLFTTIGPLCQKSIHIATKSFESEWDSFKRRIQRRIPLLPSYAQEKDLRLTLPNSSAYFREILGLPQSPSPWNRPAVDLDAISPNSGRTTTEEFEALTRRYSSLAEKELAIESEKHEVSTNQRKCEALCLDLASRIDDYLHAVGDAYENNPEQMSVFILCIFELWVYMDKCALVAYPLLRNYHPWVKPDLLDILLLSRLSSMERLQRIQLHLHDRCTQSNADKTTIFSNPLIGGFVDRYFDYEGADEVRQMQNNIEASCLEARRVKEIELERVNTEFKDLTEKKTESSCTQRQNPDGTHDIRGCRHCYFVRRRRRLKIKVHEDFIPLNEKIDQKKAIIFELSAPKAFMAYRNTTWNIIATLCPQVDQSSSEEPAMLLGKYPPLQKYDKHKGHGGLTLASRAKSYMGTHYNWKRLPAKPKNILLPLGLHFSYYDAQRKLWLEEYPQPLSFAHHFALRLPKHLPFSNLYSSPNFAADGPGPSSYEVIASVGNCPSNISVHEFMAHQSLLGGKNRRWLSILIELGSSNINFSLLDTTVLFHTLALQAGPRLDGDNLRAIHIHFKDFQFCNKLIKQIEQHVDIISPNWRENNYMETLLTITIQLCTLCCSESLADAHELLMKVRRVTLAWITTLRTEMRNASEVDIAETAARYCFLSALLCRRTFVPHVSSNQGLDAEAFKCFIEATLAMQEALVVDMSKFTTDTRNMLVRDVKMVTEFRPILLELVRRYPTSVGSAIDTAWPNGHTTPRSYTEWEFLPDPHRWWVTSTVQAIGNAMPQAVHCHLIEGHLLVDGQAIGKLPADIRDSEVLKELFGNQRLVAFPSNMPGMSYTLAIDKEGHQIHLGYRKKQLVIQAQKSGRLFELVPRYVFGSGPHMDLPSSWVDNCVHWLDIHSCVLEVRRHPHIWRESMWTINISTRKAERRYASLVDPHSHLFGLVAKIFRHFEEPHMLTVVQPNNGTLRVELKRMDLSFFVNKKYLLQCRQLFSELDPNQDAGTLYGLCSMLVLRNVFNRSQRSIITTLGHVQYQRHGMHVLVNIENNGTYARYIIDDVLGRLYSPPEPRLLYNKALVHAFTSSFIPDPLTGRTGTEEALHCLQAGNCKHWAPLSRVHMDILTRLSELSPRREYYPKDKSVQQQIHWDSHLTTTIQHDAYQLVVDAIVAKSRRLSLFHIGATSPDITNSSAIPHLRERAVWRRCLYERPGIFTPESDQPLDIPYISRDCSYISKRMANVREIVNVIRQRPQSVQKTRDLGKLFQKWKFIGGYMARFTPSLLEECLSIDLAQEWGGLVRVCRDCSPKDTYRLIFLMGAIAFGKGIDMTILRVIMAFYLLEDLRDLVYPPYSSFDQFKANENPTFDAILGLIKPSCVPYRDTPAGKTKDKKRNFIETHRTQVAREEHDLKCAEECQRFADFLLNQWPCPEPSGSGFESIYLDVLRGVDAVVPEWLRLYKNLQLSNHIQKIQEILDEHCAVSYIIDDPHIRQESEILGKELRCVYSVPRLGGGLLQKSGPRVAAYYNLENIAKWVKSKYKVLTSLQARFSRFKIFASPEILELEKIVNHIRNSSCPVRSGYGQDLQNSINALLVTETTAAAEVKLDFDFREDVRWLNREIEKSRAVIGLHYDRIIESLSRGDPRFVWLQQGNIWPCMTPVSILEQLRSTSNCAFGSNMKDALISYGIEIAKLQQLIRMKEALGKQDRWKMHQEYINQGHVNWHPSKYPDWLLLEIDSNIKIREEQVLVALEMISPRSGSNSVLQMNMGKGKTSVIMPMVASILADGEMLSRLLVPKALLSQTGQILQARLGGLLGREISYIPFSRRTPTTPQLIEEYRKLHGDALHRSGIILGIPEHVLSFKLSGLQRISDAKVAEAVVMVNTQRWLNQVCRDILDECDFTLAVRTQLIYPSGSQLTVDGHPNRWEVTMTILGLVAHHLRDLARDYPQSIDVMERTTTEFPIAYFLRNDAEVALTQRIVDNICFGQTWILPIQDCTRNEQEAIRVFISQEMVDPSTFERVSTLFADKPKLYKNIFLLRGLLVHGILLLCLKKRWNVQYGLHPNRDPMAVPFHAKGIPSDQAEWGHPDVAILFTCLAFYHEGLTENQLQQSLQAVLRSDDPTTEYDRWTQSSITLPESLRHWNIINVEDKGQITEIWRHLRFTIVVINHFLRNFVFPVHAKQFSIKLQASGWDIPLHTNSPGLSLIGGTKRPGITTGFSGTNDNRRLLPLTIQQRDLPGLQHTNAEVLTYLLQEKSRQYVQAVGPEGRRMSELDLLHHLRNVKIQILIDAGAFILEMNNQTLVRAWLQEDESAQAAVYFGLDNKPWVQYQNGKTVPLIATPFSDNMENCLVYLDEAHTRGTDLKLPPDARGALTLGLNQTKDHTVQGTDYSLLLSIRNGPSYTK